MRNLALVIIITLITLILWLIMGVQLRLYDSKDKKTVATTPVVSGTIDIDYLRSLSNN